MSDLFLKKVTAIKQLSLFDLGVFVAIVIIASLANVLLKHGVNKFVAYSDPLQFITDNLGIMVAYVVYVIPIFLTVVAYRKYKVSIVQSIIAMVYIFTPILAWLAGLESLNIYKIAGVVVITVAVVYIVNLHQKEK